MYTKLLRTFLPILLIIIGTLLFVTTAVHALYYAPEKEVPEVVGSKMFPASTTPATYPARLVIPSINLDAKVEHTGISFKGNMSAPSNFTDVGWYRYGTVPGKVGSAVIAGHVDNGLAMDGVFKHLQDLHIGDDVYVYTKGGTMLHFVVGDVKSYYYTDAPRDLIFHAADGIHLNLITCDGNWLPNVRTDDRRLVVYTTLVE